MPGTLAQKAGVEMPISQAAYEVLYEGRDPKLVVTDLMGLRQAVGGGGVLVVRKICTYYYEQRPLEKYCGGRCFSP